MIYEEKVKGCLEKILINNYFNDRDISDILIDMLTQDESDAYDDCAWWNMVESVTNDVLDELGRAYLLLMEPQ